MEEKITEQKWRDWLRGQFAANRPWNEIVNDLLTCDGEPAASPSAKFMVNDEKFDSQKVAHDVARLFLGMNLQCAQCHDHPTVKGFEQADFYGIYAYLAKTDMKPDKVTKKVVLTEAPTTGKIEFKSVFKPEKAFTAPRVPGVQDVAIPTFAPGEEYEVKPDKSGAVTELAFWKPDKAEPFHTFKGQSAYDLDVHPDGMRLLAPLFVSMGSGGNGAREKQKAKYAPNAATIQVFNLFADPKPAGKGKKKA